MPNSVVELYRKFLAETGQKDDRDDYFVTQELGDWARQSRPELFQTFPDFETDFRVIREANSPGTLGGIINTGKSAFDRSVQAKNVIGTPDETDAADIARREQSIQGRSSSVPWQDWQTATGPDAVKVFLRDPIEITSNIVASGFAGSLPALAGGLAGGAAGATFGPAGGAIGAAIGTGAGSLAVEYGGKYLDTLREAGADLSDPDSILRVVSDPAVRSRAQEMGLRRGLPVAVFDAASAGLAGKFLKGVRGATTAQNIRHGMAEAALQGGLGGAGEIAGALGAGEQISPGAVFEEVVGELGPGAVETGGAALRRRMAAPAQPLANIRQNIPQNIPSVTAPLVTPTPSVAPVAPAVISPARRVAMMSAEEQATRFAELSALPRPTPTEGQELELLRSFVSPAAAGATGVSPLVEAASAPAAAPSEPENNFSPPAPVSPESGEIQYTIQRPQEYGGRTIPGYVQIERRADNGRGEPLTDAERAAIPAPPDWLPTGQYTAAEVAEAVAKGPPVKPPLSAPAPAAVTDVTPNAVAGAAPVVLIAPQTAVVPENVVQPAPQPPSAPVPVGPAITPAPVEETGVGAVTPEAATVLADQLVKIQARRAKTGEMVEVEMTAVKAEKMLGSYASTLRKLIDCLST